MSKRDHKEKAVALQYNTPEELPKLIAKGTGEAARTILRLAEENSLPIEADPALLDLLFESPVGTPISDKTFDLVAEVLSFLYYVDAKWREKHAFMEDIVGLDAVESDSDLNAEES